MLRAGLLFFITEFDSVSTAIGIAVHCFRWLLAGSPTHDHSNCCLYRVDLIDDEQQACSKHVEAYYWNKLKVNSASFWFILYRPVMAFGLLKTRLW